LAEKFAEAYYKKFGYKIIPPKYTYDWFLKKCDEIGGDRKRYLNSIGTNKKKYKIIIILRNFKYLKYRMIFIFNFNKIQTRNKNLTKFNLNE